VNARDKQKNKAQLIKVLESLRRRLAKARRVNFERKQVEEELWGKSEFLHSVINSASEGIVVLDENANYRLINPASSIIMGYDSEDWLGKPAGTRVHPDDRKNATSGFLKALRGEASRTEARFLGADGLYRTLDIKYTPLDWAGKPHVIGVVTDITERRRAEEALRKSEESYRELSDSITDIFFAMNRDLRYTYWNKASEELTGIKAEDALGKSIFEIFPDREDTRKAVATYREVLATQKPQTFVNEYTLNDRNYFFEINAYPIEDGLAVLTKDITERRRAEEALRESESHYRLLAENVTDVVWTLDMNLRPTYVSPSVERLSGYTVEEAMTMTLEEVLVPTSFRTVLKVFEEEVAREKEVEKNPLRVRTVELEGICKDGSKIWVEVKASFLRDQNGQPVGIWGSGRDITERKQNEEKIKFLALYDQLTNLANRGLFYESLNNALLRADRFRHFVFLIYLDLDGFKSVNDEFGHKAGDSVLIEVARRIQACVRKIDTVARLGGDEFAIILSEIKDKKYVEDVVKRIIKSINYPIAIDAGHCNIGASIGISIYPDQGPDADMLLQKADAAMYRVKKAGRNNYRFSDSS
jgi:diguanylate cyclase (GGDEF)-like protein/PAS domain S-box-containing protein